MFSDTPLQMHIIEHNIDVGDVQPIKQHFHGVARDDGIIGKRGSIYAWITAEPSKSGFVPSAMHGGLHGRFGSGKRVSQFLTLSSYFK